MSSSQLSDEQVKAEHNDAEMMKRPHLWPLTVLPLKRRPSDGVGIDTAILVHPPEPGRPWSIQLGNMFAPSTGRVREYETAEAIVADGWVVD